VTLYAESSAVLCWLLNERAAPQIRKFLAGADMVVASDLTLIECDRVIVRAAVLGELTEAEAADRRAHLSHAASRWHVLRINPEIVQRARRPFPFEPVRTLDAIHLASALVARSAVAGLAVLSLDERVRRAALGMGMSVQPAQLPPTA
jgi:predicted nucleic acid-binding protein